MMLAGIDKISPYERMHIMVLGNDVQNSQFLNTSQKEAIEKKLQDIVCIWMQKDFPKI